MTSSFLILTRSGQKNINVEPGTSAYFVGANGGGKTRLAVRIEEQLGEKCHRISAHRALNLNPAVAKIGEDNALLGLRYGYTPKPLNSALPHLTLRLNNRWQQKAATNLLNDYDFLIQALFAEQSNTALGTHKNARAQNGIPAKQTKFEWLEEIWERLLPHRKLNISGDNITVKTTDSTSDYSAADMSDGERSVFYLIGQTLMAVQGSLLIFDEPELHIHRSIVAALWDELEAARPDCGMAIISHDLEFIASRKGQKFILRAYHPDTGWEIDDIPEDAGFSEEIATLILGSRKPILFVEGGNCSLDKAVFRACYPDWTVIPRGSCEEVLHAVVTMRANQMLTRVHCVGLIDADGYSEEEIQIFQAKGVEILPVSEIENLFLLPEVVEAIAKSEGYNQDDVRQKITQVHAELFSHAAESKNKDAVILRYCRRRIDRALKKIDLSNASDVNNLSRVYKEKTGSLDISTLARNADDAIQKAISEKNVAELLRWYDNKGILTLVAKVKGTTKDKFEQWVVRIMRSNTDLAVANAVKSKLPILQTR
ncbi:ABC transporter ATP-binding protein [Aquaspirillum sp. LM1]|uniref:DUF4435 domain-containing protein n=1 Tax=Aquaspirillum sp. LM1 TaxID=1938604 RepID=UPI000983DA3D|nr:DUF4435 domain-containing protein [Aquaspirillum sp. LM1]AQR64854.1 ABC transporter ATP-binding protein [Aquaspirillum sp. LM1]